MTQLAIVKARDVQPDDLLIGIEPFSKGRRTRPRRRFPALLRVAGVESDTRKTVCLTITPDGGENQAVYRIEARAPVLIFREGAE